MRQSFVAVLRVPRVRPLLAAAVLGRFSFAMGPIALLLFMRGSTGSYAAAGLATGATALMSGASAPVRGRLIDRYGQQRCLIPLATAYALSFVGVVALAGPSTWRTSVAVVLSAVAGLTVPPLGAGMRVLWHTLIDPGSQLQSAYALDSVIQEVIFTLGPLLAAGIAAGVSPAASLLAVSAFGLVGTLAFIASPVSRAWRGGRPKGAAWLGALGSVGMRSLVGSLAGYGAAIGVFDVALVAAARQGGVNAGTLLALMSATSAAGGFWYGSRKWRLATGRRYIRLLVALVLVCLPMFLVASSLPLLAVMVAALGLLIAPTLSSAYVLAADLAPEGTMMESATWVTTATNVAAAAGIASAGLLVEHSSIGWALVAAAGFMLASTLVATAFGSTLVAEQPARQPAPERERT